MKRRLTRVTGFTAVAALAAALVIGSSPAASAAGGGTITGKVMADGHASDADTVVYLAHVAGTFPGGNAEMDQHKLKFEPHVLPIVEGTTVRFRNSDPVPHNVFSPNFEKYNLGTWKQGQSKTYTFKHPCKTFPCVYDQLCLLHPEMSAYIVVLQNPYFAVTDEAGMYTIKDVPAGSYQLEVWHDGKLKAAGKPVTVVDGKTLTVNFTMQS
ncbi:MAG TPA: carboxypeptidase regulatory-like domain-containing protein [Vicinamibacterales bacterium]|nr:carboxypeptidase regulatory-like domain-containing protein [Vicinamibacterales bacterium]